MEKTTTLKIIDCNNTCETAGFETQGDGQVIVSITDKGGEYMSATVLLSDLIEVIEELQKLDEIEK